MWYKFSKNKKDDDIQKGVSKPDHLKKKFEGCGMGKDKDGYFLYTHRARSDSYKTPEDIPDSVAKFIESTG